jgi:hypothetical protein
MSGGFEQGSFGYMSYNVFKDNIPPDVGPWVKASLETKKAPVQATGVGWSGRFPGDNDFDISDVDYGDMYLFLHVTSEVKVPKGTLNAECRRMEEEHKKREGLSTLSRKRKKQIKEEVEEALLIDMIPTVGSTQVLLIPEEGMLLINSTSAKVCDSIVSLFMESFGVEVVPRTAYGLGLTDPTLYNPLDLRSDDYAHMTLEYTITDMGLDFLTWIWYTSENDSKIIIPEFGEVMVALDGPLKLVYPKVGEGSGKEVTIAKDLPTLSGESTAALSRGKKLTKARVAIARGDDIWSFTYQAALNAFGSVKLPDGEAMDAVARVAERVEYILDLEYIIEQLLKVYAQVQLDHDEIQLMRDWAESRITH